MNKKNNDEKSISFVLVGILTIVVAIAGSTYAFFSASVSNNTVISGESAYVATPFTLAIDKIYPTTSGKKLIPQLGSAINSAVSNNCIDGNGNAICMVYKITITNKASTPYYVTAKLNLTVPSTMTHLKWASSTSQGSGYSTSGYASTANNIFDPSSTALTTLYLGANNTSLTRYVVFWIQEMNEAQYDSGTFNATVTVDGYSTNTVSESTKGISSTIRS